ncbi:MAG: phage tail protein [Oscillospiraceae bacterium]
MEIPASKYCFNILIDGLVCARFAEVSGINQSNAPLEFFDGANRVVMSGLLKCEPITLKHGSSDNKEFIDWIVSSKTNRAVCKNIRIVFSDGDDSTAAVWELTAALPIKYVSAEQKADGNEMLFESVKLAHEGIHRT